jgi:hypothetical protein
MEEATTQLRRLLRPRAALPMPDLPAHATPPTASAGLRTACRPCVLSAGHRATPCDRMLLRRLRELTALDPAGLDPPPRNPTRSRRLLHPRLWM